VAGLALQYIWEKLHTRGILFAGLSLILLLPGLYWDTALHPYEYIYYNNLVGGVEGAFREYELDYWETSNKEAMEYLNQIAPQNAVVVVKGAYQSARTYARKDLTVVNYVEGVDSQADYAILSTQFFVDAATYPDSPVIHQVTRGSAVLTVIKLLNPLLTQ
jgi:hypothetical protein